MNTTGNKIWVDLDNSPHVPFFKPIIRELEKCGFQVVVTARDCFQVCGLADMLQLPYRKIGRHYGKSRIMKICGVLLRAMQMAPLALRERPVLALSHGSRSQLAVANLLGIRSTLIFDYEHARGMPLVHPDSVIIPEVIPESAIPLKCSYVGTYRGIKEDVYVPDFKPEQGILKKLGMEEGTVVVTVRPPATEAHYHRQQSDDLFNAVMERVAGDPGARMVLLPRNEHQATAVRDMWPELFRRKKVLIPDEVVDGLNLIWHSDLVVSGGGTMNREAAALGVPVFSIFRGETGIVDRYLAASGRLTLLESVADVNTKLPLQQWQRPPKPAESERPALRGIVDEVMHILGTLPKDRSIHQQGRLP